MFRAGCKPSRVSAGLLLLAACFCTGCLTAPDEEQFNHTARLAVEMEVNAPGTLAKSSRVQLSRIQVQLVSSERDTLYDVITPKGSLLSAEPAFLGPSPEDSQVVSASYDLPSGRTWKITVHLLDSRDSVRQADSLKVPRLVPFERRTVALCLRSRFIAFNARFLLPSEIQMRKGALAQASRQVYFTRLSLMEGAQVKCDTSTSGAAGSGFLTADPVRLPGSPGTFFFKSGSFGEAPGVLLADEYVKAGIRNFTLNAYGYVEGDTVGVTPVRLLFQGTRSVNTAEAQPESVALEWQALDVNLAGPSDDSASPATLMVTLGKVGTITLNVRISGAIDF
jgi:hypothetical protein